MDSIFETQQVFDNLSTSSDVNDIPKRVLNELIETYNNQKQHLKSLTGIMSEGLAHCEIILNNQGQPIDYRFLSVNPAFEKHTGLTAELCEGKTILEIMPTAEKSWIDFYGRVALTQKTQSTTGYNQQTNRHYYSTAYSDKSGEFMMLFKDITQKVELERAYKNIEESEKLKSTFLANMSHEIRTPLNAILGCSELLEDKNLDPQDQIKCLDHIKNSGNRLLTIISDILDISKLESNQQQLNLKAHCVNELIDSLYSQFTIVKKESTNTLNCHKAFDNDNSCIETDTARLEQIISNLLENAYKYTENGEIIFGYELKGEYLEFFVKDTGSGIPEKDQELIFERFGQASNQKTKINSGSGLGIPIANGFVALFGGEMWLESEVNRGSSFYFTIPYLPCEPEATVQEKPTILVAEDEEVNFFLLEMWLGKYCNLLHASNGNEVLKMCKSENIDLILMDIKMPYLNGIEATIEIRKTDETIPIIAQSAFIMQSETDEILAAGCNEVMTKPIKQQTFKQVLKGYLPQLRF
ncbi:ATP-binding protein [Croceitalea rosinachiae]|uniref:histidine kinase n=1 Tax=Croceitalea rosinachiae TaxID=3075596 RepID=A0ABU3AAD0_9FLAO|nr:ATP-binding protein [Croceitalea sp. F388]MDT0605896.1 ATP-binding protein [Croceitalea sp. F388]